MEALTRDFFHSDDGKYLWSICGLCEQGTQTEQGTQVVVAQEESVKAVSIATPTPADAAVQVDVLTNTASMPSPSALVIPPSDTSRFVRPPPLLAESPLASKPPPVHHDEIQSLRSGYTDFDYLCQRRGAVRAILREVDSRD